MLIFVLNHNQYLEYKHINLLLKSKKVNMLIYYAFLKITERSQ